MFCIAPSTRVTFDCCFFARVTCPKFGFTVVKSKTTKTMNFKKKPPIQWQNQKHKQFKLNENNCHSKCISKRNILCNIPDTIV